MIPQPLRSTDLRVRLGALRFRSLRRYLIGIGLNSLEPPQHLQLFDPFVISVECLSIRFLIGSFIFVRHGMGYRFLNNSWLVVVGTWSYSIYVWQQPFFFPAHYGGPVLWWRCFPQNILLTALVWAASYYFVERTVLKLRGRVIDAGL